MILIRRPETDPWFNLAAEEYFLKNCSEDIAMIWQCSPSVIIGKHQNAMAEVNFNWTSQNEVPIIRRLTGGGTVYHDLGNINFSLIRTEDRKDKMIDFKSFTNPIVDFLGQLGLEATFNGKNNLFIGNKKISGNAANVHRNRVVHHGTLLFNSNLSNLDESIRPTTKNINDKAVKSVRSVVTNIREHFSDDFNSESFKSEFEKYILNHLSINDIQNISEADKNQIKRLATEKYKTWDWTFGYSPTYTFESTLYSDSDTIKIEIKVAKGLIDSIQIIDDQIENQAINKLLEKLVGLPHHPVDLDPYLRKITKHEEEINLINKLLF